jgi:hypothetical protein
MTNENTYRGFDIVSEYPYGVTYVDMDNEDGSGKWSGWALSVADAKSQIDDLLERLDD